MISIILDFLMAVFVARLIFWLARLFLTDGRREQGGGSPGGYGPGGYGDGASGSTPDGADRAAVRRQGSIDRSSAIDVPFIEIPPEGASPEHDGDAPGHDTDAPEHDTDIRSAAGDR